MTIAAATSLVRTRWRTNGIADLGERITAEESPVAIVHDGTTTAVMMATPADLEEFAIGFTLSEGLVEHRSDIRDLEVVHGDFGVEVRLWLASACSAQLAQRRRYMAGPTGCGLCGIDSLSEASRPASRIEDLGFSTSAPSLLSAMQSLEHSQSLGTMTRAVHAAALWRQGQDLIVREDVGRHNALDKLIGAAAGRGGGAGGVLLLTSRVSVEMVQKAAVLGAPILCAVSAPTALAVRTADTAGLTLIGVARADGFEIFTHAHRVLFEI